MGMRNIDLARLLGLTRPQVSKLFSGLRQLQADEALKLSAHLAGLSAARPAGEQIEVIGSVQAGVWRESFEWAQEDRFTIVVGQSPFPGARRFGLRVDGESMNMLFPEGTLLDCVCMMDVAERYSLPNGAIVIVQRGLEDGGDRETTVKRWTVGDDGRIWLVPQSTHPEFQAPIPFDGTPGEEVSVLAVVVGYYVRSVIF